MGFYGEGGFAWNILAAGYILCHDVYHYPQEMQKGLGPDEGLLSRLLGPNQESSGPDVATSDQLREVVQLATIDLCPPTGSRFGVLSTL
jgi:hypothetical protein